MISGEMMKEIIRNSYLEDEKVLIVGYGKSGIKSSELAKRLGATVYVYDDNKKLEVDREVVEKLYNDIKEIDFENIDITVLSPGVPIESEVAQKSIKSGIETIGEIEFGFRYSYRNNTCNNRNKWKNNYNNTFRRYYKKTYTKFICNRKYWIPYIRYCR